MNVGVPLAIGRRQFLDHRQRGRDRGDAQPSDKAVLEGMDLLAHGAGVADDAACPVQHPFALGREVLETRATIDQKDAERVLELFDARR